MSVVSAVLAFKMIKLLTTPFNKWEATKKGILDDSGKVIKQPVTSDEKQSYGFFEKIIRKLKVIMQKTIGSSKVAALLATLYLIKDQVVINKLLVEMVEMDEDVREYMKKYKEYSLDLENQFFDNIMNEGKNDMLEKGTYKFTLDDPDDDFKKGDKFVVKKDLAPEKSKIPGISVYKVKVGEKEILIVKGLIKKIK
jgi:hypothetical protein